MMSACAETSARRKKTCPGLVLISGSDPKADIVAISAVCRRCSGHVYCLAGSIPFVKPPTDAIALD